MKYRELLAKLDAARAHLVETKSPDVDLLDLLNEARVELRRDHGREMESTALENDPEVQELLEWIAQAKVPAPIEDLAACVPAELEPERPVYPEGARYVELSQGRMVIMPREEPFVAKAPILEEASEDTVGKD